jgi:2-haloacid dehalogenase
MTLDRREFLGLAAGGLAVGLWPLAAATGAPRFRAIAFDAFPIFDPRPVFALAEAVFPGKGAELSNAWRTRQFEYQWLRALSGKYLDFWRCTEAALVFAAELLQLELTADKRDRLMQAYLALGAWPDVAPALRTLKAAGIHLALLSNMTRPMLEAGINNAGLTELFEHVLSTDQIRTYKPDPRAYQMAIDAFQLTRQEILFAAFAGWDVAGARWFGYPTFWVNRLGAPAEQLGTVPDGQGAGLEALVKFIDSAVEPGVDSSE